MDFVELWEIIPVQSLLYKTTTCLMQQATTFFLSPKWKEDQPLKKTNHLKTLSSEEMGSKHKEQCIKYKRL